MNFHDIVLPLVRSDDLWTIIEEELLCSNILSVSLKPDVVGSVTLSNSVHWHSGDKVEWSHDVESEFFAESLGLDFLSLVSIENLPSLLITAASCLDRDSLSFFILGAVNGEAFFVLPIDKMLVLVGKDLPPSSVGAPDLSVVCFS